MSTIPPMDLLNTKATVPKLTWPPCESMELLLITGEVLRQYENYSAYSRKKT
jgi:hypothetical protein